MKRSEIPFNIDLLELTPAKLSGLKPVRVLDIFDGASGNFHEDGLFSVSIFGQVGDERRSRNFSYIDIKTSIFHPILHRALVSLKRLYGGIIAGTEYALWDKAEKDFVRSDAVQGRTGFAFFVEFWKDIVFEQNKSTMREQNILLINKYRNTSKALFSKVVVMPAGMRDLERDEGGRIVEDEINGLYRQLLKISNTISDAAVKTNQETIDTARYALQLAYNEIFETFESMIEGKKKLLMGKWASRRIFNGTRNVITSMDTSVPYLGAPGSAGFNNTIVGLYQAMKAALPISIYHLNHGFLARVFTAVDRPTRLVSKKTLKPVDVQLKSAYFDRWTTSEGLEKVITLFGEESLRHKPLEIDGHYLGLIYKGPDKTFRLIQDIDEVPEGRNKRDVTPITFAELMYTSVYRELNKLPLFFTRYPVTGVGSIYASKVFVKTTVRGEMRRELADDWTPMDDTHVAYEFPQHGMPFVNSLVPHSAHLDLLDADFDGDTASGNVTYSDESIAEVDKHLASRSAYVGTNGQLLYSTDVSTVKLVLHNLTVEA